MRAGDEFLIENRLREDRALHGLMKGSLFALDRMLQAYATRFPCFTDHSLLHSMNVLRYCNEILGVDGVNDMNAGECYVLVMSCYLHDIGMAIGDRDYAALVDDVVPRDWWDAHPDAGEPEAIRAFHHEFSGRQIRKYAALFEIPDAYVFPMVQVSRGHRKTDLMDSAEYPTLILAPRLGAMGVWLSLPIGLIITLGVSVVHAVIRNGHWPRSLEEWLMLPADFGTSERLVLTLRSMEDVTRTSARVQAFCSDHGIDRKAGFHAGLCLEEIAGNIVRHGFSADRRRHEIEVRVVLKKADVMLRIKDDCIAFNPREWVEMAAGSDPLANVGIRLVYKLAEDVSYQNLLGLNVLTINMNEAPAASEG